MWFSASKKVKEQVWMEGFQAGFSKAWDMMIPMLYSGFEKTKQELINTTKVATIKELQSAMEEKYGTHSKKD